MDRRMPLRPTTPLQTARRPLPRTPLHQTLGPRLRHRPDPRRHSVLPAGLRPPERPSTSLVANSAFNFVATYIGTFLESEFRFGSELRSHEHQTSVPCIISTGDLTHL